MSNLHQRACARNISSIDWVDELIGGWPVGGVVLVLADGQRLAYYTIAAQAAARHAELGGKANYIVGGSNLRGDLEIMLGATAASMPDPTDRASERAAITALNRLRPHLEIHHSADGSFLSSEVMSLLGQQDRPGPALVVIESLMGLVLADSLVDEAEAHDDSARRILAGLRQYAANTASTVLCLGTHWHDRHPRPSREALLRRSCFRRAATHTDDVMLVMDDMTAYASPAVNSIANVSEISTLRLDLDGSRSGLVPVGTKTTTVL